MAVSALGLRKECRRDQDTAWRFYCVAGQRKLPWLKNNAQSNWPAHSNEISCSGGGNKVDIGTSFARNEDVIISAPTFLYDYPELPRVSF